MKYLLTTVIVLMAACSSGSNPSLHYQQDYENVKGWVAVTLEDGFAYSGKYCQKIERDNEFSHGFTLSLAEAAKHRLKKIKANVKVTAKQIQQEVYLVIDIYSADQNKSIAYNMGTDLSKAIGKNRAWTTCTNELDIPSGASGKDVVKVYLWNPNHEELFMDDLEIIFEK